MATLGALGVGAFLLFNMFNDASSGGGREINWQEFKYQLLEQGLVSFSSTKISIPFLTVCSIASPPMSVAAPNPSRTKTLISSSRRSSDLSSSTTLAARSTSSVPRASVDLSEPQVVVVLWPRATMVLLRVCITSPSGGSQSLSLRPRWSTRSKSHFVPH